MSDENRKRLEAMSRDDLIAEIIERQNEAGDREEEFAGLKSAETISDSEADKYAALLKEMDRLVMMREANGEKTGWNPYTSPEEVEAVLARWRERIKSYAAGDARKAAKAAAKETPSS